MSIYNVYIMCICMYVCTYVRTYVRRYIYIYIYIHKCLSSIGSRTFRPRSDSPPLAVDARPQSYISKGIRRQGIGSFVRNSYVSTLCPVVVCPSLCTPEEPRMTQTTTTIGHRGTIGLPRRSARIVNASKP